MSNTAKPSNPYYDYVAVRNLNMFFGREDELQEIYEMSERQQSVSIVGPPRIGKSSLLHHLGKSELQQRLEFDLRRHLFVLLDLRDYLHKTQDDFFHAVCEQIVAQSQQIRGLELSSQRGQDQFSKLLQQIHKAELHPILLMDAFDRVTQNTEFDPTFFSFLRSLATRGWVSYVTASVKRLVEVCHPGVTTSPFFNIFRPCPLGPLTPKEAWQLVTIPASRIGYPFSWEEATWIIEQAGRHPFFLQVTCRLFFEEKYRRNTLVVDLNRVQEEVYNELQFHFDNAWSDLDEVGQNELMGEIRWKPETVYKIPELSESGLFRRRIRERFNVDKPDITIKDIKEALDNLEDNEFLANSKLADTYYISTRYKSIATSPINMKGLAVRDFLKAAFEKMRASNIRTDSEFEWRSYNILYYHYFKYHLPNEHTAARLGIGSRRQFYREQDKAIQALQKEVCEMERIALNEREV